MILYARGPSEYNPPYTDLTNKSCFEGVGVQIYFGWVWLLDSTRKIKKSDPRVPDVELFILLRTLFAFASTITAAAAILFMILQAV